MTDLAKPPLPPMTVGEVVEILQGMDQSAILCLVARDPEGDGYEDPVIDVVGMGKNVVLLSEGTMP